MPCPCGLGTRKIGELLVAPLHLDRPLLEELIHPVVDGLSVFQRDTELSDVNGVLVVEFDFMLDDVCPSEIKLPLTDNVMVPSGQSGA